MVLLEYTSTKDPTYGTDFGTRAGQVTMIQPISLDPNKKKEYQIQSVIISPEIPNIYSYGGFNNTSLRISNNAGVTWSTVILSNGIYQINMIQDSITNAFLQAGWILDSTHIPVIVDYNPASRLIYVQTNSSQLTAGTVGVDFGYSLMYQMLGFTNPASSIFTVDSTYVATLPPNIDVQGTYINVVCNLITGSRYVNGQFSSVICKVPLTASTTQIEIVFPSANTGSINVPFIEASIPNNIMSFSIDFQTSTGQSVVFLYGNAICQFIVRDKQNVDF